ncbi:metallopeptidase family protein [Streptomyces sp. ODS28]|uniref:metallopeptidase family protein n=1 Tax=Streptomyces sp. ODS28 TaxID=3136688 RepID=UPI0031ED9E45
MNTPVPPRGPEGADGAAGTGAAGQEAAAAGPAGPRRRDRHGRGMRGPLAPPQVPLAVSRADFFDDLVRDSVNRLERSWPELARVEFAVQEVPRSDNGELDEDAVAVPLGRTAEGDGEHPDRIVVYRRPVEIRTRNRDERALLVHEVVVEQVAELLGMEPESVDPRYGQD